MARAVGLMNPENAAKSSGGFKEGFVRIDFNSYKVHQAKGEDSQPATKWAWSVTRLQEDGETPMTDEHDAVITEELYFSFGGKSLPFVHPGKAESSDDEEPEDLGITLDTEGNTIFLNAPNWAPNEKSGLMMLTKSLVGQGVKAEYLNRCWAPDWNGCVFELKSQAGGKTADGKDFNYKVVSKVLVGPGAAKKGSPAAKPAAQKTTAAAASNGAATGDAGDVMAKILSKLTETLDGQTLSRKVFTNRVRAEMEESKTDSKLLVPVLSLCKDEKWLGDHANTFDYRLNSDNTITFGTPQTA